MSEDLSTKTRGELEAILAWCLRYESAGKIDAILKVAQSELSIRVEDLDADPWLLNCPNGTVGLKTGTLREHRREDYITTLCPTEHHPEATCPRWERFLLEVFDENANTVGYVRRLLGYCLTGTTTEHVLPVLWGSGANGKSTMLTAVMQVLGKEYSIPAPPNLLMSSRWDRHPTELAKLYGKRLVVAHETGKGRAFDEAKIKQLTGGDQISARRMGEDFWEFTPTHKFLLATNYRPEVGGDDTGIWRRLKLIPFTKQFLGEDADPDLGEKLKSEYQGILAWLVRGCLEWQADGLGEPEDVTQATQEYRQTQGSQIDAFIRECCEVGENYKVSAGVLYERYLGWFEGSGEKDKLSRNKFGREMTDKFQRDHDVRGAVYFGVQPKDYSHDLEDGPEPGSGG
jgi:putative DNA primase/helicase